MINRDKSINKYFLKIKKIVYFLVTVGSPIYGGYHINVILDSLSNDFEDFIISIMVRLVSYIYC